MLFLSSTLAVNIFWMSGNLLAELDDLLTIYVIKNIHIHYHFVMGMNVALAAVGVISSLLGLIHSDSALFLAREQERYLMRLEVRSLK